AYGYAARGRYADASRLFEETLALQKAKFGPDHPATLTGMHNLATSQHDLGQHADASRLLEQTLALRRAKLSPDHPDTLTTMHNLANSYSSLGRHADALRLHRHVLTLMKAKLGADHPTTFLSRMAVAHDLDQLDRGSEALPVIDDCVKRATAKAADPRLLPRVMNLRLRHFEKARDAAGCRQTAQMWEDAKRSDAESLYRAA